MGRVSVVAGLCLCCLVALTVVPAGVAGLPPDDYVDRYCTDAPEVSGNATVSGRLDYEGDRDTFKLHVDDGDVVSLRLGTEPAVEEFRLVTYMLGSHWATSLEAGRNARTRSGYDLQAVLENSSRPGYVRAFPTANDTLCLKVTGDLPSDETWPVSWTVTVATNGDPGWYRAADRTPTPTPTRTSTPAPTQTPSPTPAPGTTATPAPSPTPTPEPTADTDGDGVVDSTDYAPRDPRVQSVSDVRVVTETTGTSNGLGPGFGPVATAVALVALGVGLAGRR